MGDMPIGKLLFRLSPPVMLALLIQSIYNIVDSYFVAQYSLSGADVRLADLPRDRSAVGALCAGFLPGRAFSVKTPKCRIIF